MFNSSLISSRSLVWLKISSSVNLGCSDFSSLLTSCLDSSIDDFSSEINIWLSSILLDDISLSFDEISSSVNWSYSVLSLLSISWIVLSKSFIDSSLSDINIWSSFKLSLIVSSFSNVGVSLNGTTSDSASLANGSSIGWSLVVSSFSNTGVSSNGTTSDSTSLENDSSIGWTPVISSFSNVGVSSEIILAFSF